MADKQTLEERIEHFLRLAVDSGATQHERDLASEQAERLMIKHGIERTMLDTERGTTKTEKIVTRHLFCESTFNYEEMVSLSTALRALGLYPYSTDYRKYGYRAAGTDGKIDYSKPGQKGFLLTFVGHETDADDAIRLVRSLQVQLLVALKDYEHRTFPRGRHGYTGKERWDMRRNFVEYFGFGVANRIRETRKQATEEVTGSALVLVDRTKKVQDWVKENLDLGYRTDRRRINTTAGRSDGFAAGKNANTNLSKGIGSQGRLGH